MNRSRHHAVRRRGFTLVEVLVVVGVIALLAALTVGALTVFGSRAKVRSTETTLQLLDAAVEEYTGSISRPISFGLGADADFELLVDEPHVFSTTRLLGEIGGSSGVREIIARIEPRFVYRYNEAVDADGDGSLEIVDPEWIISADPADPNDPGGVLARTQYTDDSATLDDRIAVIDAWGTPIRAVHHGPTPRERVGSVDAASLGSDDILLLDPDGTWFLSAEVLSNADYLGLVTAADAERQAVEAIYGRCRDRKILFVSAGPDRRFGDLRAGEDTDDFAYTRDNVYSYPIDRAERSAP